jgi:uncharacterized membrane protein YozB (DUF420 family)
MGYAAIVSALTTKAPSGAVLALVLSVVAAIMFTVGWRLAVARRYAAHRRVQTAAVVLSTAVIAAWMIRSFVLYVAPQIPARLSQRAYAVATVHAVVGVAALVLGVYVVLGAFELVPPRLRFKRFKPIMRSSYALYLLGTLTGVVLFAVAYAGLG